MNLLQSFMGCVYPSIRTESIESIEPDYQHNSFQARNVDEYGNEISRGELQITDDNLIYFKPSAFPTRWPLGHIRRYGSTSDGERFVFEVGRKSQTGEAIYAFKLDRNPQELVQKLSERIDKLSDNRKIPRPLSSHTIDGGQQHDQDNDNNNNTDSHCGLNSLGLGRPRRQQREPSILIDQPATNRTDPKPLSYAMIDFDTTKALNESAQAHAAQRVR